METRSIDRRSIYDPVSLDGTLKTCFIAFLNHSYVRCGAGSDSANPNFSQTFKRLGCCVLTNQRIMKISNIRRAKFMEKITSLDLFRLLMVATFCKHRVELMSLAHNKRFFN